MSQKTVKSILPFSKLSQNRSEPFTKESERAAIFCLAELEREKGGRLIMKQPPEKLVFIAEVCYPFWLVAFDEIGLLFDGLSTTSYALTYFPIPEIQLFLDNVNRSSKTRQAYMTFLSDNVNYFQASGNEERNIIDGLITDLEFLQEFTSYLSEATPVKTPLSDVVLISPAVDESSILSKIQQLRDWKSGFVEEVNALYTSMKLLNAKTENFVKVIRKEIEEVRGKFDKEIEKFKASVAGEVDDTRKEYDEKVTEFSKAVEEKLLSLQQEKIKFEKIKEQLTSEIEHCESEIKTCAINKDGVSEHKWKEKRDQLKRQLSETEAQIKELDKEIEGIKDEKKLKIFELKSECEAKINEVTKNLVEIESSRDAKIRLYEEEIEKLEELTSTIIKQIDKLAKLRETSIREFDKLGIKQQRKECTLIYMPFYLACYQSESRKRYAHFPPSIVNSVSFAVRFKGALGKARVKQLLQPRSQKIVSLLNKFPVMMEQNAVFDREMNEACAEANRLRTKDLRESIKNGLVKLKEEGWFSEKEFEVFYQILA